MPSLKRCDEREVLNLAERKLLKILNQHNHQENSENLPSYEDLFYMAVSTTDIIFIIEIIRITFICLP